MFATLQIYVCIIEVKSLRPVGIQHSDIQHNDNQLNDTRNCYTECRLCCVANQPIQLRVTMLSVVMLSVIVRILHSKVVSKLLLVTSPIVKYL